MKQSKTISKTNESTPSDLTGPLDLSHCRCELSGACTHVQVGVETRRRVARGVDTARVLITHPSYFQVLNQRRGDAPAGAQKQAVRTRRELAGERAAQLVRAGNLCRAGRGGGVRACGAEGGRSGFTDCRGSRCCRRPTPGIRLRHCRPPSPPLSARREQQRPQALL